MEMPDAQSMRLYREEALEQLAAFEQNLLTLEIYPNDKEAMQAVFRALHSIKGASAMFGLQEIADIAHRTETGMEAVKDGTVTIRTDTIDQVLGMKDKIMLLLPNSDGTLPYAPKNTAQEKTPVTMRLSQAPLPQAVSMRHIRFKPTPSIFRDGNSPINLIKDLHSLGDLQLVADTNNIPTLEDMSPELCYFSWDMLLESSCPDADIQAAFMFVEQGSLLECTATSLRTLPQNLLPAAPRALPRKATTPVGKLEVLLFMVRETLCAVPLALVEACIHADNAALTHEGIFRYKDRVVPIQEAADLLELGGVGSLYPVLVILQTGNEFTALLCDLVLEIASASRLPNPAGFRPKPPVSGLLMTDDQHIAALLRTTQCQLD